MRKIDWRAFAYTHKRLIAAACAVCLTVAALCALGGRGGTAASATQSGLPVINVGCDDYAPFNYTDVNGNSAGIDVELAKEAFGRMGYQPEFHLINWEDKQLLLANGTIDCVWGSFSMNGREDEYKWAGPYMQSYQVVAVNVDSDIYTFADLEGKTIAVQSTTKPEEILRAGDSRIPQVRKVLSVQKRELIFTLLSKGYVDALAAHATSVEQFMSESGLKFRVLDEPLQTVGLGVAFDKDDTRGLDTRLNEIIKDMRADGTVREVLAKYMSDPDRYLEG